MLETVNMPPVSAADVAVDDLAAAAARRDADNYAAQFKALAGRLPIPAAGWSHAALARAAEAQAAALFSKVLEDFRGSEPQARLALLRARAAELDGLVASYEKAVATAKAKADSLSSDPSSPVKAVHDAAEKLHAAQQQLERTRLWCADVRDRQMPAASKAAAAALLGAARTAAADARADLTVKRDKLLAEAAAVVLPLLREVTALDGLNLHLDEKPIRDRLRVDLLQLGTP